MSESECEAALAFAHANPVAWDAFRAQWFKEHPQKKVEETVEKEEGVGTVYFPHVEGEDDDGSSKSRSTRQGNPDSSPL